MFSRYRSYTTYSEENGKLVPSVEPIEVKPTDKTLHSKREESETEASVEKKLKSININNS
jgi:hypothetical protein